MGGGGGPGKKVINSDSRRVHMNTDRKRNATCQQKEGDSDLKILVVMAQKSSSNTMTVKEGKPYML